MLPNHKKIKVLAKSEEDLYHISLQLKEGICPISAMVYEKNTFSLLVNRFCWNHQSSHMGTPLYCRANMGLLFCHVTHVMNRGFHQFPKDSKPRDNMLNLLHIDVSKAKKGYELKLIFSHDKQMLVQVSKIEVYLNDLHDGWPTWQKPTHLYEHHKAIA